MAGLSVNDELERTQNEALMTCLKLLPHLLLGENEECITYTTILLENN
jgi:hypothetical protein